MDFLTRYASLMHDSAFFNLDGFAERYDVILKIEGLNPAGSIKYKTALSILDVLSKDGVLKPGDSVVESSSGNLGVALSFLCRAIGSKFYCICDPNVLERNRRMMEALGAEIINVTQKDEAGSYLGTRIKKAQEMESRGGICWTRQYENPAAKDAHKQWTMPAIEAHIPDFTHLFVGAGTTGTLMGCAEYLEERLPEKTIYGVDSLGSITFGYPAAPRYLPGLGTSRVPELFRPALVQRRVMVPESETIKMCWLIRERYGLLIGPSTATVLCGIARSDDSIRSGSKVVAISPDLGERYIDTVFNIDWVSARYPAIQSIDDMLDLEKIRRSRH